MSENSNTPREFRERYVTLPVFYRPRSEMSSWVDRPARSPSSPYTEMCVCTVTPRCVSAQLHRDVCLHSYTEMCVCTVTPRCVSAQLHRDVCLHSYTEMCVCTVTPRCVSAQLHRDVCLHSYTEMCVCTVTPRCVSAQLHRDVCLHSYTEMCVCTVTPRCVFAQLHRDSYRVKSTLYLESAWEASHRGQHPGSETDSQGRYCSISIYTDWRWSSQQMSTLFHHSKVILFIDGHTPNALIINLWERVR
ncbi:hypothetical protein J6590_023678 [Homalodisca vitripennis]|nr:hypothetical protein J6590_023678 [Homalodisca vitripennis]